VLIVWVYLHSIFLWWAPKNASFFCSRVHIGRSRSSKVVHFSTNRKGVCDFLLVINSNFGPVLHVSEIRRLIGWKLLFFPTSLSLNALARGEPFRTSGWIILSRKLRVLGLSIGEDFMILARVVFTQCQRVTDGRTDGRTDDMPIVASTGLA